MPLVESVVQSVVKSAVQRVDGVISTPSLLLDAFGAWGTHDFYGAGNAVVRLRNSASSPTERDFTATELTDGTYTSWYSSGQTYVSKMYDQKGSNDLYHASTSQHPKYDSSDNTVQHYQPSQYIKSYLWCDASTDIANTFDGNTGIAQATTLVASGKKPSGSVGFTTGPAFGIFEGYAPTSFINRGHRSIVVGGGSFATKVGVSMRTEYPPATVTFDEFQSDFPTSFKTYHALFNRVASVGTVTALDLYQDGTQTVDETTTTLGTNINQDRFVFGDNSGFKSNALFVFNKEFDSDEIDSIHTELSANY